MDTDLQRCLQKTRELERIEQLYSTERGCPPLLFERAKQLVSEMDEEFGRDQWTAIERAYH